MTHDNPANVNPHETRRYVKLDDMEELVYKLIEYRRKYPNQNPNENYDDGWEEACATILDRLSGWCAESVKVKQFVEAP